MAGTTKECVCGYLVVFIDGLAMLTCSNCGRLVTKDKSILDGLQVKENSVAKGNELMGLGKTFEVVSSCPSCGAPIYSDKRIPANQEQIKVKYSCSCRHQGMKMETK